MSLDIGCRRRGRMCRRRSSPLTPSRTRKNTTSPTTYFPILFPADIWNLQVSRRPVFRSCLRYGCKISVLLVPHLRQNRDLVAISPTGTGKTLAYLLPIFARLGAPAVNSDSPGGVRAVVVVPTRELAHQIHNECLKLAQGRKWKIVLFSKATANALSQKAARDKVGTYIFQ